VGYGTYVCNTDGVHEREEKIFRDAFDRGVDGIVLAARETATKVRFSEAELATPVVCLGEHLPHPQCDAVVADDEDGSCEAAAFLVSRGYQSIAMVQGPAHSGVTRTRGFVTAMHAAGRKVPTQLMVRGDWTRRGGIEAVRGLLALPQPPDAIFCANDMMAIGALDVARELGLRVPEDLAVVGFDDVDAATIVTPALTTVRNPSYDAGLAAGELLLTRMSGDHTGAARTVTLPCPLVVRASA
jgi:LacI family transcriptional regulator